MLSKVKHLRPILCVLLLILLTTENLCYEKTLRKIVRNQSKMIPRPFSESIEIGWNNKISQILHAPVFPGYAQVKAVIHKIQRPKISTIFSSVETSRSKTTYSKLKLGNHSYRNPSELRSTRDVFGNITGPNNEETSILFQNFNVKDPYINSSQSRNIALETYYSIPATSMNFPHMEQVLPSEKSKGDLRNNSFLTPKFIPDSANLKINSIIFHTKVDSNLKVDNIKNVSLNEYSLTDVAIDDEKPDFILEELPKDEVDRTVFQYNISIYSSVCSIIPKSKTDIDALKKFEQFDLELPWVSKKRYWNRIFNSRYEYLMRNPKWPSLKVILVPRTHVDTIWKQTFEQYHNNSASIILTNIVKKLKFYSNLTFQWNEVSHLSHWWKSVNHKTRAAFRRLLKSGRLEITTGGWVESDEATTDVFGLVHLLIEGHQWLKIHMNYTPKVAWLTNSVAHSPTVTYLLSSSGISYIVFTNLHYSWEKYLAEYQLSDFVWVQEWDSDRSTATNLNDDLSKIGNEKYPKYSVLSHYLQFNSGGLMACGPNGDVCVNNYDFGRSNMNINIDTFNIKNKSEILLEQYSKTGTITPHNVIIAPIGGAYHYESQTEFDFQYNNYKKIADFINSNHDIYRSTVEYGTPSDYFSSIIDRRKSYTTLKGDFLNFADIRSGSPAYWVGYFTSRPLLKISIRRLQSTLRATEILFTFALSVNSLRKINSSNLFALLTGARENVARLQDRNVVSGTLTVNTLSYVNNLIVNTIKDCWYIQELTASLLSVKPGQNTTYLHKYVYRDGEFISTFKTVSPGDQIYIFNSLSHERTDVVELMTRNPNVRIIDHNRKDVTIQINPVWKYDSDNLIKLSGIFFKIYFVITIPPMTLELFQIKDTYDATQSVSTVFCNKCFVGESNNMAITFPFQIQPIDNGDIQLENYKLRLIFDESTGFLKNVIDKETNLERTVRIDFGAFKTSDENSGIFLFNTNASRPLYDILSPYRNNGKLMVINSGKILTELTSVYGRLLQHSVKIFNTMSGPLSSALYTESRVDFDVSPKNREVEIFISIQTDISNGNQPEIFVDNNGFQFTSRAINISKRVESNMYPLTSVAFIQDQSYRLTIITDHAQGVTALQEGQLVVMLDRRVLYNDGRGTSEGLADSSATVHRHYLLLENFAPSDNNYKPVSPVTEIVLPSLSVRYLANSLNYIIDIFLIDKNYIDHSYYTFLPLIKSPFPCDVAVINYRVAFSKQLEKTTSYSALMTLQRQSFTCKIHSNLNRFCKGETTFNLEKILRNVKAYYKTNLVGTSIDIPVSDLNHVNFPPMELITLRIYF